MLATDYRFQAVGLVLQLVNRNLKIATPIMFLLLYLLTCFNPYGTLLNKLRLAIYNGLAVNAL